MQRQHGGSYRAGKSGQFRLLCRWSRQRNSPQRPDNEGVLGLKWEAEPQKKVTRQRRCGGSGSAQ